MPTDIQVQRCEWCRDDPLYQQYHDQEWGRPCRDDTVLFEYLVLEGAQAGLNWLTILRRREGYREAFCQFDPARVAAMGEEAIERLMLNPGIIRNRRKINSAISNARAFLKIQARYGSFCCYLWQFVNDRPVVNQWQTAAEVPATTPLSDQLSKALKKEGFSFVGSTLCYAYMQAAGLVNDHLLTCSFR